jgi:hypothetical protein
MNIDDLTTGNDYDRGFIAWTERGHGPDECPFDEWTEQDRHEEWMQGNSVARQKHPRARPQQ